MTTTTPTPAQLGIGFANNDEGVHVSVMQSLPDGKFTVIHHAKVLAGDSFTRVTLAAQPSEGAGQAEASQAGRQYQRKVDEKIIARRDAEIASLRAGQAGQVAKLEPTKICRKKDGCEDMWKCSSARVGDCGAQDQIIERVAAQAEQPSTQVKP